MRHKNQRIATLTPSKRKAATELLVPIGTWKDGMYCIEIPEIRADADAPMPRIWSQTREGAEEHARVAIKAFEGATKGLNMGQIRKSTWLVRNGSGGVA